MTLIEPEMHWTLADARALVAAIEAIDAEGLIPADYLPAALRAAIAAGEGPALDVAASKSFAWLIEDLRDGRTPMEARVQWFAVDPDQDVNPTTVLMAMIRANMDRWRWLTRDLGTAYLMTNVPEFQLRLVVRDNIIRTYRTVVGKPGRTATPQLAETVSAVVFNPTWTVPQSIVVGEGLGPRLLRNPAAARRQGYAVTKAADGTITVVQQPGDGNSLGRMKIDMPNPHAIYLHDTPSKSLFNAPVRAFSHGCIRTENAVTLGMTMAILGAGLTPEQSAANFMSMKYTKVEMTRTFPVYITYFTMGQDVTGKLATFGDIYGRDAPVLASFEAPRKLHTTQRMSTDAVIKLDNPL